jgi:hypothetical protein
MADAARTRLAVAHAPRVPLGTQLDRAVAIASARRCSDRPGGCPERMLESRGTLAAQAIRELEAIRRRSPRRWRRRMGARVPYR